MNFQNSSQRSDASVHEKINLRGAIEHWRNNTERAIKKSIDRRELVSTGKMRKSVMSSSTFREGSIQSVTFRISIYAMFLDMAVSKGHPFGSRKSFMENRSVERALGVRFTRQPRLYKNLHWMNKVIYGRSQDLAKMQVNIWGKQFMSMQIPTRIELTM